MTYLGGGGSGDEEMEALRNRLNGAVGARYHQQHQQQRGSISAVNHHMGKIRTTSSEYNWTLTKCLIYICIQLTLHIEVS